MVIIIIEDYNIIKEKDEGKKGFSSRVLLKHQPRKN